MTDLARQGPTVWARMVLHLIGWARGEGLDPKTLLCQTECGLEDLEAPDSRIPLVAYYDLMEIVSEALGTMGWAPRFVASLDFADLEALGFLMATSPTLGDAFERMLQYQRLYNDGEHFGVGIVEIAVAQADRHLKAVPVETDQVVANRRLQPLAMIQGFVVQDRPQPVD